MTESSIALAWRSEKRKQAFLPTPLDKLERSPDAMADLRWRGEGGWGIPARTEERTSVSSQNREKQAVADCAADLVQPGMVVGLGTGSTADLFLHRLAERVRGGLGLLGVPTSDRTRTLAMRLGIPLCPLDTVPRPDLTIDGADEIDADLRLIKGAGGALLREKIVAAASRSLVIIADSSKWVGRLGATALPVEVVPFGWERTAEQIIEGAAAFVAGPMATHRRGASEDPYRTDGGHYILDCTLGPIADAAGLAAFLDAQPGVVEHGLFLGLASAALIGRGEAVETIGRLS